MIRYKRVSYLEVFVVMAIAVPSQPRAKIAPSEAGVDLEWLANRIEYRQFQDCVHCGLCTASCPTYVETGDENDSPRGRIYLMRAVVDGRTAVTKEVRRHLDLCLDCRMRVGMSLGCSIWTLN